MNNWNRCGAYIKCSTGQCVCIHDHMVAATAANFAKFEWTQLRRNIAIAINLLSGMCVWHFEARGQCSRQVYRTITSNRMQIHGSPPKRWCTKRFRVRRTHTANGEQVSRLGIFVVVARCSSHCHYWLDFVIRVCTVRTTFGHGHVSNLFRSQIAMHLQSFGPHQSIDSGRVAHSGVRECQVRCSFYLLNSFWRKMKTGLWGTEERWRLIAGQCYINISVMCGVLSTISSAVATIRLS